MEDMAAELAKVRVRAMEGVASREVEATGDAAAAARGAVDRKRDEIDVGSRAGIGGKRERGARPGRRLSVRLLWFLGVSASLARARTKVNLPRAERARRVRNASASVLKVRQCSTRRQSSRESRVDDQAHGSRA